MDLTYISFNSKVKTNSNLDYYGYYYYSKLSYKIDYSDNFKAFYSFTVTNYVTKNFNCYKNYYKVRESFIINHTEVILYHCNGLDRYYY